MDSPLQNKKLTASYTRLVKSLLTLQAVISDQNIENPYLQDAMIKRFEYTYEAAWKAAKFVLAARGVETIHPADIFREAFAAGWILDPEVFRDMIVARNTTNHQYSENRAEEICKAIRDSFFPALQYLQIQLEGIVHGHP